MAIIITAGTVYADSPGFRGSLKQPNGDLAQYPQQIGSDYIISITPSSLPMLRMRNQTTPKVVRSNFEHRSITFGQYFYKRGQYSYPYVDLSVDALVYHKNRKKRMIFDEFMKSKVRVYDRQNKSQGGGGLIDVNIPIKSGAIKSIAGEGGVGLKVTGTHQISFSGQSSWDDKTETSTYKQSKFPSLNMEQISRFTISGTIGTKISVSVTQDSKSTVPLANRLMIRYKGDEDDVIKSIEAGNTTLSLPNTQFVGYSTRIQGLFGLKAEAQIGGLSLTTIMSQEKGSTEKTTLDAGSSASSRTIKDYEYIDGKIFDLGLPEHFEPGDTLLDLALYGFVGTQNNAPIGIPARMYVDPTDTAEADNEVYKEGIVVSSVQEIDPETYEYYKRNDVFYVIFDGAYTRYNDIDIGAYMKIKRGDQIFEYGNITPENDGDPYILKLIKTRTPTNDMTTWNYMWRNVYNLKVGSSNEALDLNSLDINIFKGNPDDSRSDENLDHQNGIKYIRILGLDATDPNGQGGPDNKVDVNNSVLVDDVRGLLIFPNRNPFADSTVAYYEDNSGNPVYLNEMVPSIYTEQHASTEIIKNTKYYLVVSSKSRASEISLGKTNIIEGSERVVLNGSLLERGQDYTIDYDFGRIRFKDKEQEATDPNSELTIDFEYSPFILTQKKTLFGVRGEYELSKNFQVGSTFLFKSDKATDRKPKVGEETSKMSIWDADASFRTQVNFLSTLANALPFYSTEQGSNISFSTEIAKSYPNPNVDGIAYLDDFEGSRDAYSLGVTRGQWEFSSKPVSLSDDNQRAKLLWYNPYSQVPTTEIWNQDIPTGGGLTNVLTLEFFADTVDRRIGLVDTLLPPIDYSEAWAGIMRSLSSGVADQEEGQLVELRLKGSTGILHLDFGQISEDADGNGTLTTEDIDLAGNSKYIYDEGEDVGLDGLNDAAERVYYGLEDSVNSPYYSDPSGDNWDYDIENSPYDYSKINGTENNKEDPDQNGKPDTEDINNGKTLDNNNDYFSYRIDLGNVLDPFYVEGTENANGWKTYRIPIKDSSLIDHMIGSPDWSLITFVRLWIESPDNDYASLSIASFDLISSNWKDTLFTPDYNVVDEDEKPKFNVAVISDRDNDIDTVYTPPPGVSGYYNKAEGITENEQSLLLKFENFKSYDSMTADTGIAVRNLLSPTNLLGYRNLKMFVHGPEDLPDTAQLMFFFRVGTDEENYYEFRRDLVADWADNEVNIDFNEITALKEYLNIAREENPDSNEIVDGNYRVFGDPDITRVKYLANGVVNKDTANLTGDVWVDELRLTDVRKDVGTAARFSASGNVADLFTYNFGYSYQDAYFRKISASTRGGSDNNLGSGKSTTGVSVGFNFKLDKFLPRSYNASLPFGWRYSKNTTIPLLKSGTDIFLPEELQGEEKSQSTSKSITFSESFNKKTKNPLFSLLLNNIKSNFSYNRSDALSPTIPMSMTENIRLNSSYSFNVNKPPSIRLFFWTKPVPLLNRLSENKLFLFINTFSAKGDFSRSLRVSRNSSDVLTETYTRDFKGDLRVGYKVFDNLTTTYSMSTRRDLSDPNLVVFSFSPSKFKFGIETDYTQSFGLAYNPTLFSFLTHKGNFSANYNEDFSTNNNTRTITLSKSYSVGGTFDHTKLFGGESKRKRRFTSSRRGSVRRGEQESESEEKGNLLAGIFGPPGKVLRFLTSWINPFTYDFKETYNYSYIGLKDRAQLKFRFGMSDNIGAEIDTAVVSTNRSTSVNKSTNYSLRSGTTFLGGLKTDVGYSKAIRQDIVKSINPQKTMTTNFPDINFTLRNFTTFKFLNSIVRKFSPKFKYSRSKTEKIDLTSSVKTSEEISTGWNPLLAFSYSIFKGMVIDYKTSKSVSEKKSFNKQSAQLVSEGEDTRKSTSISTKYSFSWPRGFKFPILGRLRIKSTMSISVNISMTNNKSVDINHTANSSTTTERSEFMVSPTISYSFSSQIKGGLTGRWRDQEDKSQDRRSHVRELRFWVDIRF